MLVGHRRDRTIRGRRQRSARAHTIYRRGPQVVVSDGGEHVVPAGPMQPLQRLTGRPMQQGRRFLAQHPVHGFTDQLMGEPVSAHPHGHQQSGAGDFLQRPCRRHELTVQHPGQHRERNVPANDGGRGQHRLRVVRQTPEPLLHQIPQPCLPERPPVAACRHRIRIRCHRGHSLDQVQRISPGHRVDQPDRVRVKASHTRTTPLARAQRRCPTRPSAARWAHPTPGAFRRSHRAVRRQAGRECRAGAALRTASTPRSGDPPHARHRGSRGGAPSPLAPAGGQPPRRTAPPGQLARPGERRERRR